MAGRNKNYRMVALDLDGTLLRSNDTVSNETVEYLRKLYDKGFTISIATGRLFSTTWDVLTRLNIPGPFPVLSSNGACAFHVECRSTPQPIDTEFTSTSTSTCTSTATTTTRTEMIPHGGKFLFVRPMFVDPIPLDVAQDLIDKATTDLRCMIQYYVGHDIYANPTTEAHHRMVKAYAHATGKQQILCQDGFASAMKIAPPLKMLVFTETSVDKVKTELDEFLGKRAHIVRGTPPYFCEVLRNDVCKGFGLQKMAHVLKVPTEEIIAFGDGDNDLEFLQIAGRGIAMKNARTPVKKVADEICHWTNDEDGVIRKLSEMERDDLLIFNRLST